MVTFYTIVGLIAALLLTCLIAAVVDALWPR